MRKNSSIPKKLKTAGIVQNMEKHLIFIEFSWVNYQLKHIQKKHTYNSQYCNK